MLNRKLILIMSITMFAPRVALAHVGLGDAHDALHGFLHPILGLDHILAMITVGLLAANLGGRARWAVPVSFVSMMLAGGIAAMSGMILPFSELGVAMSVIMLGGLLSSRVRLPVAYAAALAGIFAIFHGYAHGLEMPQDASGISFALGFLTATASLHIAGLCIGLGIAKLSHPAASKITTMGGGAIVIAGIALISSLI